MNGLQTVLQIRSEMLQIRSEMSEKEQIICKQIGDKDTIVIIMRNEQGWTLAPTHPPANGG